MIAQLKMCQSILEYFPRFFVGFLVIKYLFLQTQNIL